MRTIRTTLTYLALIALMLFPVFIYFNAQALTDWWQLRGYSPPAAVMKLASDDTMTPGATHDFYVNHPDIESSATQFRTDCKEAEQTIVLGCYHSNQDGIFVYNVSDSRLAGVEQVTAAHEMLHAAYDRLSSKDRNNVNTLLQNYYDNGLHDQRIIDTINSYRQSEPNDVVNEMHSVFGTEVANLPAPLETYYKRYFLNRQTIINFANNYESEFTTRESQIKAYSAQLSSQKNQINSEEAQLQQQLDQINTDRAALDSLRSSGQARRYNNSVDSFNAEINTYNSQLAKLRVDISNYNVLVEKYNAIASELASLEQAIDSRLTNQAAQ